MFFKASAENIFLTMQVKAKFSQKKKTDLQMLKDINLLSLAVDPS